MKSHRVHLPAHRPPRAGVIPISGVSAVNVHLADGAGSLNVYCTRIERQSQLTHSV